MLKTMLVKLALILLVLLVALVACQRRLLFPRHLTAPPAPGAADRLQGLVRLERPLDGDDVVEAWWLPSRRASSQTPAPAVIFAHGNAELIDHWPEQLDHYRRLGLGVLLVEYRGYGRSGGSPSQADITDDFIFFYDLLRERPEVDPARIVFHGRSLGGGVVSALAAHRTPAAVILQSTFTSVRDIARGYGLLGSLVRDPFDSLSVLKDLHGPVLIAHGRRDQIIPVHHARTLAEHTPNARLVLYDCDHNDCPPSWPAFWTEVDALLERAHIL